jgi:hypothetical protein
MLPQEEAIKKIRLELSQIFRQKFGKDLNSELIKDKPENIMDKFRLIMAAIEILSRDEKFNGARRSRKRPLDEEKL